MDKYSTNFKLNLNKLLRLSLLLVVGDHIMFLAQRGWDWKREGCQTCLLYLRSKAAAPFSIFNETLLNVKTWSFAAPLGLFPSAKPPRSPARALTRFFGKTPRGPRCARQARQRLATRFYLSHVVTHFKKIKNLIRGRAARLLRRHASRGGRLGGLPLRGSRA